MTIPELHNSIETAFAGLANDIYFGDPLYHFSNDKVEYSSVVFSIQNAVVSEDFVSYTYNVTFADRLTNGTNNEYFIFNDGLNTIELGLNRLDNIVNIEVEYNHRLEPYKQKFADVLAGWQTEVTINVPNDLKCD